MLIRNIYTNQDVTLSKLGGQNVTLDSLEKLSNGARDIWFADMCNTIPQIYAMQRLAFKNLPFYVRI